MEIYRRESLPSNGRHQWRLEPAVAAGRRVGHRQVRVESGERSGQIGLTCTLRNFTTPAPY